MNTDDTIAIPDADVALVMGAWIALALTAGLAAAGIVPAAVAGPVGMVALVGMLLTAAVHGRSVSVSWSPRSA